MVMSGLTYMFPHFHGFIYQLNVQPNRPMTSIMSCTWYLRKMVEHAGPWTHNGLKPVRALNVYPQYSTYGCATSFTSPYIIKYYLPKILKSNFYDLCWTISNQKAKTLKFIDDSLQQNIIVIIIKQFQHDTPM